MKTIINGRDEATKICGQTRPTHTLCLYTQESLQRADLSFKELWDSFEMREESASLKHHRIRAAAYQMNVAMTTAMQRGMSPSEIREQTNYTQKTYHLSEFVQRVTSWPRGYRGDFETIQNVINLENPHSEKSLAYFVQQFVLDTPMSQQHRNKVYEQSKKMHDVLYESNSRILSVACGYCPDLSMFLSTLQNKGQLIVVNDFDDEAIKASSSLLAKTEISSVAIPGDAFRKIRAFKELGPFDLILAGGLFDYLDEKAAKFLCRELMALLTRSGELFLTNLASDNPYRGWLECVADWPLHERSHQEVIAWFSENTNVSIRHENTGLTMLISAQKT